MKRYLGNPLIVKQDVCPSRPDFTVLGVFNPGAVMYGEETLLILRVAEIPIAPDNETVLSPIYDPVTDCVGLQAFQKTDDRYDFSDPRVIRSKEQNFLTSMSHLRLARSRDGYHFTIDEKPFLVASNAYETFGIEDARITFLEGSYYINYSAASNAGIITSLISTQDFVSVKRLGNIFHPDNKDVTIFPERIGDYYYALHRPSTSAYGKPEIWMAQSPDLISWGNHKRIAQVRKNSWDSERIGAGAVPVRTPFGWLEIYHGATHDNRYCLGAMLLDLDKPWHVLARSLAPLVEPEAPCELDGFFGNVVFSCGAVLKGELLRIYYGASDDSVACIDISLEEIWDHLGLNRVSVLL